jgi:hypothetical protein
LVCRVRFDCTSASRLFTFQERLGACCQKSVQGYFQHPLKYMRPPPLRFRLVSARIPPFFSSPNGLEPFQQIPICLDSVHRHILKLFRRARKHLPLLSLPPHRPIWISASSSAIPSYSIICMPPCFRYSPNPTISKMDTRIHP